MPTDFPPFSTSRDALIASGRSYHRFTPQVLETMDEIRFDYNINFGNQLGPPWSARLCARPRFSPPPSRRSKKSSRALFLNIVNGSYVATLLGQRFGRASLKLNLALQFKLEHARGVPPLHGTRFST